MSESAPSLELVHESGRSWRGMSLDALLPTAMLGLDQLLLSGAASAPAVNGYLRVRSWK